MKFFFVSTILIAAAAAACSPSEPRGHEYIPPTPEDSRSPCPGLNSMANHGWLPRSGKNIDLATFQAATKNAFNFEPHILDGVFQDAINFNFTTTGNRSTINLEDLKAHDTIEMDGSLSRNDFYFGDDLHFDPVIWSTTANRLGLYDCGETEADKWVTVETAGIARALRVRDAKVANPQFNASSRQQMGSPGTTALYLASLWNDTEGAILKTWVRSYFEKERLPYLLGYDPHARAEQNLTTLTALVGRVAAAGNGPDLCLGPIPCISSVASRDIHGFHGFKF
ncbi:Chloroperoxidase [Podospora fimiseda]|uniref:Chloroperoxidase n=1 Tax=Podospora fimiseda TaxID=252190 RepID=A0AAN7BJQ2_9PEZI|nr:Chloroperoxidase [Podospora fimiseda]